MNDEKRPCLGVDFGRVIQGGAGPDGSADTAFLGSGLEAALRSPATEGALEALERLTELFERRVWIISKCGPSTELKTRRWLDHHEFWRRTGVPEGNARFCRQRADKAIHCADLGVTHMIDDRLDVHQAIRELVPYCYLFGPQEQDAPDWVTPALTWSEAEARIRADLAAAAG